jgi:hypothetical protein
MSGPITAGYFLVHGMLALTARAIAEARAMKCEYAEVLARLRAREGELADARAQQQAARLERVAAVHRQAALAHARLARMRALADTLGLPAGELPQAPASSDDAAWTAYLSALDAASASLDAVLARNADARTEALRARLAATSDAPTLDDVLSGFARQRALSPGLDAAATERLTATAARVLSRLDLPRGVPLPTELEALARAIVLAPSLPRAEALATELRLAVQRARDARAAQARDADDARQWLAALPDDAPAELVGALERVAAGVAPLPPDVRAEVERLLEATEEARARADEAAAAYVLEESLRDLGYEVEGIEATLFADGGAVNFRRAGWDRYFVRLRVSAEERTVNFNVVRARGDEETAERRRLDALAEDRWCAEFPALMRTLAARGLTLDVTRRLGAGELPVQVVDPSTVPLVREDERAPRSAAPRKQRAP